MAATPVWSGAQAGVIGNAGATASSAQINQLLGTHPDTVLYQGSQILTPGGTGATPWNLALNEVSVAQPFRMSGTVIGRVQVPLLPVGNGADLLVELWTASGSVPGSLVAQTRIPASWIAQLSAVAAAGPSSSLALQLTGSPIAAAQFNTLLASAPQTINYPYPTASSGGVPAGNPASTSSGNYYIQCGGSISGGGYVTDVFTIAFAGGTVLSPPIPQPAMPAANSNGAALAVTNNPAESSNTIVVAGGPFAPATAAVYTASFDPSTGTVASWSTQAALPQGLYGGAGTAWNDYVYVVGGSNSTGAAILSTLYYAVVANGQIQAWNTSSIPTPLYLVLTCVCNGFLFVIGGYNGSSAVSTVYFAALNPSTGAPGPWQTGPALPVAAFFAAGDNCMATANGVAVKAGGALFFLGVSVNGPAASWVSQQSPHVADTALFPTGPGTWQFFNLLSTSYVTCAVNLTPMISVPLPATGLTNYNTYFIVLRQPGTPDLNNYLCTSTDFDVFPTAPTLLTQAARSSTWTTGSSQSSIPLAIYDQTATGQPWHTWEDSGARITTLVNETAGSQQILGICETTRMGLALNANQGFETGTSPWTATNCTLTQSSTRSYSGLYSGQVVPNGTSGSVFITSEHLACEPGQSVTASAWLWFTAAVTSNLSLSVSWYNASGGLISTSSALVSVAASTWTEVAGTLTAPALASTFTIVPTLSGTPPATNVWFLDNVIAYGTYTGPQQSTVTQLEYSGTTLIGTTTLA